MGEFHPPRSGMIEDGRSKVPFGAMTALPSSAEPAHDAAPAEALPPDGGWMDDGTGSKDRAVVDWPDAALIVAVRRESPDEAALAALVRRYWKPLFARCQMLTVNQEKALDLAQEAWCRVIKARRALKPEGNFPAYLMTIATNLWRDMNRSARRAGPMAEHRLVSLDAALGGDDGDSVTLVDVLPDLNALRGEEQARLKLDIDGALELLPPLLREVIVARYIAGESAAEIGRRFARTEQTVTAWLREALRLMKLQLEAGSSVAGGRTEK